MTHHDKIEISVLISGNFLCDAYASAYDNAMIAFLNNGGIRGDIPALS